MNPPLVTLTGPPGSGKTTAGRGAAERLGLEFVSAGELFRAEAARRGVDLATFSRMAEEDEGIDRALDQEMLSRARPGRLLEGRITGALCRRARIPSIDLVVTAREEVRVERVARRDSLDLAAARSATQAREGSERRRYLRIYGIDLDHERTDHMIDSSELSPPQVVEEIVDFVRHASVSDRV
ncbi:MAG: AAA family ATPase [Thermoplasmata archaeon]